MTDTDVVLPSDDRIGQATRVEQARAVAEVQAAVVVAQQVPRDVSRAIDAMREACANEALASKAFFRFPRAGGQVTGPAISLARELARVWGNVQYGINELRRDDSAGQSEMIAWAWDVQTNTRASTTFIVPHARDTKGGRQPLADLRDIYENNANNGARRVREMIFAVLPQWFVDEAKDRCNATIRNGGGKPLAQRIADVRRSFAETWGIGDDRLSAKVGTPVAKWTDFDVAQLVVIGGSIKRGEATVDEEFPAPARASVTASELTGKPAAQPEPERPAEPAPERQNATVEPPPMTAEGGEAPDSEPVEHVVHPDSQSSRRDEPDPMEPKITARQNGAIHALAAKLGLATGPKDDRSEYLAELSDTLGRPVTTSRGITAVEAAKVISTWREVVDKMPNGGK